MNESPGRGRSDQAISRLAPRNLAPVAGLAPCAARWNAYGRPSKACIWGFPATTGSPLVTLTGYDLPGLRRPEEVDR
jgi:hypothetical protein